LTKGYWILYLADIFSNTLFTIKAKDTKMQITNIDFDRGNIRQFDYPSKIVHGFEVTTNPGDDMDDWDVVVVDAAGFIQYLIDTNVMLIGSYVNSYRDGLVCEAVNMETTYNHQRGDFDEYSGTRSCTIQEFMNDYPIAELEKLLIQFLNDSRICAG